MGRKIQNSSLKSIFYHNLFLRGCNQDFSLDPFIIGVGGFTTQKNKYKRGKEKKINNQLVGDK